MTLAPVTVLALSAELGVVLRLRERLCSRALPLLLLASAVGILGRSLGLEVPGHGDGLVIPDRCSPRQKNFFTSDLDSAFELALVLNPDTFDVKWYISQAHARL